MFKFLLFIFIIFVALPWLLRTTFPWLFRWFVHKQTRKYMDNSFGSFNQQYEHKNRKNTYERPLRRKKIDPSVGEYVEFTEVEGHTTSKNVKPNGPVENQVSDVDWEDLP